MRFFRVLFFTFLLFNSSVIFAQSDTVFLRYDHLLNDTIDYTVDTMVFMNKVSKNMLFETTRLTNTKNQLKAANYSIQLEKVVNLGCFREASKDYEDKTDSIWMTDSSLMVEVQLSENCCYSFLCDMAIVNDTILNLITYEYSRFYCGCVCAFRIQYHFSIGANGKPEDFSRVKSVMVNGDPKTRVKIR